ALLAVFLAGTTLTLAADDTTAADEQILKLNKIATDGPGPIAYLRKLSLSDQEQERLQTRIHELGSPSFRAREQAAAALVAGGSPALPLLRLARRHRDPEIARRAENCIDAIERVHGSQTAQTTAVVHQLIAKKPAGAVDVLLQFLPFNEDEWLEEEIFRGLGGLAAPQGKVDPALLRHLQSPAAVRRAASAFVVGKVGDAEQRGVVHDLLADPDPKVRFWAAQGLLASRDRSAVPTLIGLLAEAPTGLAWKAEELLCRVAGDLAPVTSSGDGSAEARAKYRDAWADWWRDQGQRVDLSHVEDAQQHLGLTLVAEMDSNKVWEFGSDGRQRWKIDHLQGPMDAQILPGGRVLVAEYQGRCVTERDLQGHVTWSKRINGSPICCQRLANGNVFIATHNSLLEVTRDGKEIRSNAPVGGLFLFSAQKLANGHIVCMANPGLLKEFDAAGKTVKSIQVGKNNGGWCGVEALPGGRYLVSLFGEGKVFEISADGKRAWQCSIIGASHATRLANGHTLIASMMNRRVVEVDREGKTIKETATDGRPWKVHRR
ncbi:MAG TPA: HEAT repeat domain-containing protein, partial [Gemmataceae bacterium]|nr:HEAT repeat domain-containing protein [Gemmataceae bacterium]